MSTLTCLLSRRRVLASVSLAVVAALSLSACADDAQPVTTAELSGYITFWHAYGADSQEAKTLRDVIIPGFKAKHPGTDVKEVAVPYDQTRRC